MASSCEEDSAGEDNRVDEEVVVEVGVEEVEGAGEEVEVEADGTWKVPATLVPATLMPAILVEMGRMERAPMNGSMVAAMRMVRSSNPKTNSTQGTSASKAAVVCTAGIHRRTPWKR